MRDTRFSDDQSGVSDMVGTVLLLAVTVALFGGLALAVMQEIQRTPAPSNLEFRVDTLNGRTSIVSVWGESLELDDVQLLYEVDAVRLSGYLSDPPLNSNVVHRPAGSSTAWDLGENLRLGCAAFETCAYPGASVTNVTVIQRSINTVLFSSEPGVGLGSVLNPLADLAVTVETLQDPARPSETAFYNGGTFVLTVKVSNSGLLPTAGGATITTRFYLDGSTSPFHTDSHVSILGAGDQYSVANTALALATGPHSIRVQVESSPVFIEAALNNNEITQSMTVVAGVFDPGSAYEDGNDDVLYNPYSSGDTLLPLASVTDGAHTTAASKGLVLPGSVGTISPGSSAITFVAAQRLTIATTLQTASPRAITLIAGTQFNLSGVQQVRSGDALTITAGGQVDLSQDSLDTNNRDILITSSLGRILAPGASFYISGLGSNPRDVTLTATSGAGELSSAVFRLQRDLKITVNGALHLEGANLDAGDDIDLGVTSPSNTVYVGGITVNDDNDCADVSPSAATIAGTELAGQVDGSC